VGAGLFRPFLFSLYCVKKLVFTSARYWVFARFRRTECTCSFRVIVISPVGYLMTSYISLAIQIHSCHLPPFTNFLNSHICSCRCWLVTEDWSFLLGANPPLAPPKLREGNWKVCSYLYGIWRVERQTTFFKILGGLCGVGVADSGWAEFDELRSRLEAVGCCKVAHGREGLGDPAVGSRLTLTSVAPRVSN
jgi:hypothetical protein